MTGSEFVAHAVDQHCQAFLDWLDGRNTYLESKLEARRRRIVHLLNVIQASAEPGSLESPLTSASLRGSNSGVGPAKKANPSSVNSDNNSRKIGTPGTKKVKT
jgi:hypothetical protein